MRTSRSEATIGERPIEEALKGNGGEISGYFVSVAWEGTPTENTKNYFGAKVVKLVG
jgi:hypothetical protein